MRICALTCPDVTDNNNNPLHSCYRGLICNTLEWRISHVHYSHGRMCKLCMCPSEWLYVCHIASVSQCGLQVCAQCLCAVIICRLCVLVVWVHMRHAGWVTVQTGTRAPGLMLSSCGMHRDQLFLNHMTPLLPPSGFHHTSLWSLSPAIASEVEGEDNFRAHSWRKPTSNWLRGPRTHD